MDDAREDILENRFFQILQQQFESLYAQAQKNCWLIIVPTSQVLNGFRVTPEIIGIKIYFY